MTSTTRNSPNWGCGMFLFVPAVFTCTSLTGIRIVYFIDGARKHGSTEYGSMSNDQSSLGVDAYTSESLSTGDVFATQASATTGVSWLTIFKHLAKMYKSATGSKDNPEQLPCSGEHRCENGLRKQKQCRTECDISGTGLHKGSKRCKGGKGLHKRWTCMQCRDSVVQPDAWLIPHHNPNLMNTLNRYYGIPHHGNLMDYVQSDQDRENIWRDVAEGMRCKHVAISVGDRAGRRYTFENMGKSMSQQQYVMSGSKWPSVVAIVGAVQDEAVNLSWDDTAAAILGPNIWPQQGWKSLITLRHLLTFTSGLITTGAFKFSHQISTQPCLSLEPIPLIANGKSARDYTLDECAKQIADTTEQYQAAETNGGEPVNPGILFQYNSLNIQVAMAMAVKAAGLSPLAYLRKYLFEPAGLSYPDGTTYVGLPNNPVMASGMRTTGDDYDKFLREHLRYNIINKETTEVTETDVHKTNHLGVILMEDLSAAPYDVFPFAMGNELHEASGCRTMGGAVVNCIHRNAVDPSKDYYFLIMPSIGEYAAGIFGKGHETHGFLRANCLNWLHEPIAEAMRKDWTSALRLTPRDPSYQ